MNRLTGDLFEITELAHHGPEDLLISVLTIVGALGFMFSIEWRLALVVAIIIPIFLLVVMVCRRSMADASIKVKEKMAAINADIESCISGMRTSKRLPMRKWIRRDLKNPMTGLRTQRGFTTKPWEGLTPLWSFLCVLCRWLSSRLEDGRSCRAE